MTPPHATEETTERADQIETTNGPSDRTEEPNGVFEDVIQHGPFPIRFPKASELDQDQEWCEVEVDGDWRRVRFHDYHEVYNIPGLYETIFYRTLRCNSPVRVANLLGEVLTEHSVDPETLSVLDLGAGNGMVGEAFQTLGTRDLCGVDIIPEAKTAAERDRPWVYNDYMVADFTDLAPEQHEYLASRNFNTLATVAALGFGDIPDRAFATAFNLIDTPGWIACNIKEDFLQRQDQTGFSKLIQRMVDHGVLQMEAYKRYCHRLSITGEELYYIAVVAQKLKDIPEEFIED